MSTSNENVRTGSWEARFMPGWWILPGVVLGAAAWVAAIWLFATR